MLSPSWQQVYEPFSEKFCHNGNTMILDLRGTQTAEIGELIREAMRRKGEDRGDRYTFRDLEQDAGVNFAYAARVVNGERQPSRTVVKAMSRALAPYLPLEEAMVAAGFVEPDKQNVLSRLAALPRDVLEEAERWARIRLLKGEPPDQDADGETDDGAEDDQSQHKPHP